MYFCSVLRLQFHGQIPHLLLLRQPWSRPQPHRRKRQVDGLRRSEDLTRAQVIFP